jgi:ankyrin repeat protein
MSDNIQELIRACKSGDFEAIKKQNWSEDCLNTTRTGELCWLHWLILGVNTPDEICIQILDLLKPGNVNHTSDNVAVPGLSQIQKVSKVTPLHLALHYKGPQVINKLLELGANPDAQDSNGDTCLTYAARGGSCEKIELLLNAGADMMISNNVGGTALSLCTEEKTRLSMTRKLNDKLMRAVKNKQDITSLIASKADPMCSSNDGTSCLVLAIQTGDYNTILQLLEQTTYVDGAIAASTGNTALHEALTTPFDPSERVELVSELIYLKADVNAKNSLGKSPLDLVIEANLDDSLKRLLTDNGAELSKQPVTIGKIIRQQSANPTPQQVQNPPSPSGDVSPRAPDTIDLSEVAGRAGGLFAELQKAREFVGSISAPSTTSIIKQTVTQKSKLSEADLKRDKAELESKLQTLTSKFDSMKSKNKNISDFRSIGEFLDLQKSIAECRTHISEISSMIEKGEFGTSTTTIDPLEVTTASSGWFRSPDSIEADIEQCIRTIRKSTNNSTNIESAIFEFVRRAGPGLRTNEGIPILKLLRNRGSEINLRSQNMSPFSLVCDLPTSPDDELVDWMLSNGVDLTATVGDKKWTCLFFAALRGHTRVCEKILKRSSKNKMVDFINVQDSDGKTAMDYASNRGVTQLLKTQTVQPRPDNPVVGS